MVRLCYLIRSRLPPCCSATCSGVISFLPGLNAADSFKPGRMKAPDMANLMPATVFFRGQVATVQARNSGGVKLADGMFVLCALVDTSGYSTAVQQKYQAYFITEVTLDINGQTLTGSLRRWFCRGQQIPGDGSWRPRPVHGRRHARHRIKAPDPVQVLDDTTASRYRLYINRNYVGFSRVH